MKSIFFFLLLSIVANTTKSLSQWVEISNPGAVTKLVVSGENIVGYGGYGTFVVNNNQSWWTLIDSGLVKPVYIFADAGDSLFAVSNLGLFLSADHGVSWGKIISDFPIGAHVSALTINRTNMFAGITIYDPSGNNPDNFQIILSTNGGKTWSVADSLLPNAENTSLIANGTNLFASIWNHGVFRSTNNGLSWSSANSGLDYPVQCLVLDGTNILAGTRGNGVYRSTDNGNNWNAVNTGLPQSTDVNTFFVSGINIFVGTLKGIYFSTNHGTTWNDANSGLLNTYIFSAVVLGANLYVGTAYTLYRRPVSQIITLISDLTANNLNCFFLNQNYPNPFNPSTTISFSLPSKSFVSLKVFDLIGKEVATIVSEELSAGSYTKQWNAGTISSGAYFYRLQTGSFTETRKLVLLR